MPIDQEFRASYKESFGCHIVKIEQYNAKGKDPSWRQITILFCANEIQARSLENAINGKGIKVMEFMVSAVAGIIVFISFLMSILINYPSMKAGGIE